MEINSGSIIPHRLPVPDRRDAQGYAEKASDNNTPPPRITPDARSHTATENQQQAAQNDPNYQQIVQQSKVDHARSSRSGETFRLNSDPYMVQRAMDAYSEQIFEGRRFQSGIELMPRVDAYV